MALAVNVIEASVRKAVNFRREPSMRSGLVISGSSINELRKQSSHEQEAPGIGQRSDKSVTHGM